MKPTTLLFCATVVAACANIAAPTADEAVRLQQARALLDTDPMQALDHAEALLAANKGLREARLVFAEGSMRLARSGQGQVRFYYIDAATNFDKALADVADADAPAALLMLAECRYALEEYDACRAAASRAAAGFAATSVPTNRTDAARALLLGGRCELQRFVQLRQVERESGERDARGVAIVGRETAQLATSAARCFESARSEFPGDATTQLALLHQWLDQPSEVVRELERGMRAAPGETAIHDAFIGWMRDNGQFDAMAGSYSRLVRESPTIPILRWHQGRAIYAQADKLRADGNFQGALAAYGKSDAAFADYVAQVPGHRDAANQWRALCELAQVRVCVDMGDLKGAEGHLVRAVDASPVTLAYENGAPKLVDSFGNHFTGAVFAIHLACTERTDDALALTLAFNERVLQIAPDRWGFLYNNAALAARDLGVQKATAGDTATAKELWERSYRHYEKAVELSPDDARIVNDCGLMLIYHLDRDLDRARTLFERAIEIGKAQLAALPPATEARERERLEEAVGDAWQNIAVLLREQQKRPFAEYEQFCKEAVKYYPYQRREAAALLRSNGEQGLGSTARSQIAARQAQEQGGAAEALAKQQAAIDQKVAAADFDGALTLLDGLSKECKDHQPFQLLRGEITSKLAVQARDAGRRGVDLLYQDAVAAFKRAVELDSEPIAPRQRLAQAQYDAGDSDAAARTLNGLLLHMQSQGGGKPEDLEALHLLRANAGARAYAAKKQNNEDDKELLTAVRASFRGLEEKAKLSPALRQLWSTTEEWAGAGAEAVNIWVRALQRAAADDATLFDPIIETAARSGQMPLAVEALAKRTDATGVWYLGKARYLLADAQRKGGKTPDALKTLDQAHADFAASMAKNAGFKDTCEQWQTLVVGKKGTIAYYENDAANAEKWLLEAVKARPDRLLDDLGDGDSIKRSLLFLVDRFMKKNDLGKVEAISRAAANAATGDIDLNNNSGLFARDWGNQLEQNGKQKEAMEMYEQSYTAYRRANQLDPTNVRLRNDCALIAIWHLERDWTESKQLLDSAIVDGEKTLRDTPPSDPDDKQKLDEAVGDCYENLALWQLKHAKDGKAAKAAAEASLRYHPGQRRPGARRHLQNAERLLQGK